MYKADTNYTDIYRWVWKMSASVAGRHGIPPLVELSYFDLHFENVTEMTELEGFS
jgi:hypothetical protein